MKKDYNESYEKVRNKFKSDTNYFALLNYFDDVNAALSGGGGDIKAEDVSTDDGSNVQAKLDLGESNIVTNAQNIADNNTSINVLGDSVSTLDTRVTDNEVDIQFNAGRITALENFLTPSISIADTTETIVISQDADTTYMTMDTTIWEQNSTDYYSYSGDTLTVLQDGVYELEFIANAEKSGAGGVFIDGSLTTSLEINGAVLRNASLKVQINSAGTIAPIFTGKLPISAGSTIRINLVDAGSGDLTATTNASHDAFILQISKV